MSLFQKSIVNKYLSDLDEDKVAKAFQTFKDNYTSVKIEIIKKLKEEEYQDGFLRGLFVDALGYTLKPDDNYDLVREYKNQSDAKKADGAILKNGKAIAVIELKSTQTKNLNSVTEQAFYYKNNQPECRFVITSNFRKLRFFVDYATEFEEFDLFHLNKNEFNLIYLLLSKDCLFQDIPGKLKEETVIHEEKISKQLYKDYSEFKIKLFNNLVKNNPKYDKLILFKKSQKLIDRFLFILFSEDRGLLPPNSIDRIIQRFKILEEEDSYKPLYEIYKQYFGYMNIGRKGKITCDDISAYNGGLFYTDELLDSFQIDDDILIKDLQKLSSYDYNSEIDVDILGHIFEHSLSEIEEISAELEGIKFDKKKGKRKKDGVFYTPTYVTKYIIENSIGKLSIEKQIELGFHEIIIDESYHTKRGKLTKKGKNLYQQLENYKKWLLSLKIVDPACGSGAFLNQALNFLIKEHSYIIELQIELDKGQISLFNIETAVLENNLYGVDINEESIEIAKLSLWLRTAKKGRKLSILSNNIKCGNTLIENPDIVSEKAFNWKKEFPDVFAKGGFDVVISNPPYGAKIKKDSLSYLLETQEGKGLNFVFSDSYVSFYIKSLDQLLKTGGFLSFITPNTWRLVLSGEIFRNFLSKGDYIFHEIVQHQEKVFEDATVDCDTVIIKKEKKKNHHFEIKIRNKSDNILTHVLSQNTLSKQKFFNLFLTEEIYALKNRIEEKSVFVKDCLIIKNGVKPYEKGKGKPPQTSTTMKEKPFTSEIKIDDSFFPLIGGSSFRRYQLLWSENYWIKYGEWLAAPRDSEIFLAPEKLIFRQTGDCIVGTFINDNFIMRDNTHILLPKTDEYDLKYILAILNSKLSNFIYWTINPEKGEALAQVKLFHIGLLCFPLINKDHQQNFVEKTENLLNINIQIQRKKNKFLNRIKDNFSVQKISKKLDSFYNYDFKSCLTELKKQKVKLTLAQQDEWEDYFFSYKKGINLFQIEITKNEDSIDQMIYELYGLSQNEIKIIESV